MKINKSMNKCSSNKSIAIGSYQRCNKDFEFCFGDKTNSWSVIMSEEEYRTLSGLISRAKKKDKVKC